MFGEVGSPVCEEMSPAMHIVMQPYVGGLSSPIVFWICTPKMISSSYVIFCIFYTHMIAEFTPNPCIYLNSKILYLSA